MYKRITTLAVLLIVFMTASIVDAADGNNGQNGKENKAADDEIGRMVENIDENWMFYKGSEGEDENFSAVEFDDRNWEAVHLPHTWNAEDGTDGGDDYYKGDGWYRKQLEIPSSCEGKELFLKFGAANKEAEVL